jgi:hypothetical protein
MRGFKTWNEMTSEEKGALLKRLDNSRVPQINKFNRREGRKRAMRRYRYGMIAEEYEYLWEKQDGKCAICKEKFEGTVDVIDHDHSTGRIRGLLCRKCNLLIGIIENYFPSFLSIFEEIKKYLTLS